MWYSSHILSLLIHATLTLTYPIQTSLSALPNVTYDFIIVGGGTAGSVLANRLTGNPRWNILLIEAGPSHETVLDTQIPAFSFNLQNTSYDWNYTSTPQPGLGGRSVAIPRGHVLGGCSSINGMFYTRGSSSDYDRWANVTGDEGWSWKNILPYILKNERWTAPSDLRNTSGQFSPSSHNTHGRTFVSLYSVPQALDAKVMEAASEFDGGFAYNQNTHSGNPSTHTLNTHSTNQPPNTTKNPFAYNQDTNSGDPLGTGWLQVTVGRGERSSAATAYLGRETLKRGNLHVLVGNRATGLLRTGEEGGGGEGEEGKGEGKPVVRSVRVVEGYGDGGPTHTLTASKELLLSAGSFGSPHLLQVSGIGDARELRKAGIEVLVDSPGVGKNLTDQPQFSLIWSLGVGEGEVFTPTAEIQAQWLAQWHTNRTGPLTGVGVNAISWIRIPEESPIWDTHSDPASGPNTPHIELAYIGGGLYPLPGRIMGINDVVAEPHSRGSITATSPSIFDPPLIDMGLLTHPFDIAALKHGITAARRFVKAETFDAWNLSLVYPFTDAQLDSGSDFDSDSDRDGKEKEKEDEVEAVIRSVVASNVHPVGTAAMSKKGDRWGVVDPDLRVKGVEGLRVVDASIMPFITCSHTQAAVYAIAERAADMVKASWVGK